MASHLMRHGPSDILTMAAGTLESPLDTMTSEQKSFRFSRPAAKMPSGRGCSVKVT